MRFASLRLSQSASAIALLIASAAPVYAAAPALPVGGTVVAGSASIGAASGSNVTITQTSARAVIDWTSFNVGQGGSVVFVQPNASSATLSRVTGNTASTIAGEIDATGSVYLINPNGIAITKTGVVQVGRGFVASSLDIANSDFMAGSGSFTGNSGNISNAGHIITQTGGYVGLLGGNVSNTGTILAPAGQVVVAAGTTATLDVNGGSFLAVALPQGAIMSPLGNAALVSGAQARSAVRNVVNLPDSVNAQNASGSSGNIYLGGTISVDSASGDAGHIKVLGNTTTVAGTLSAQATGASGNGGLIETSGNQVAFASPTINTSSAHGKTGMWLVDPTDLTIDAAAAATIDAALATTNVELDTYLDGSFSAIAGNTAPGAGDINIASDLAWSSTNTLTLNAYHDINITAQITAATGGLTLTAGNAITDTADLAVGTFRLTNGAWVQNGTLPAFSATDFSFDPQNASFLRVSGGDGSLGNAYQIADVYGLQGMASSNLLTDNFVLASAIDASGTVNWNGGAGFIPIGTDGNGGAFNSGYGFTGTFNGQGNYIDSLTINRGGVGAVGLFGIAGPGAYISNVGLINASVTGWDTTGALAGQDNQADFANVYSTGTVTGNNTVGGLIGVAGGGSITNAESLANVSGNNDVGGLIGWSISSVSASDAGGTVSGNSEVGGLMGGNYGTLNTVYATGAVSGTYSVGGLVGVNIGSIDTAYATGTVSAFGGGSVGGLVGYNNGAISNAYATGEIDASLTSSVGGLVGYADTGSTIRDTYATGLINGFGNSGVGGLVGNNNGGVTDSYWDSYATGQSLGDGVENGTVTNLGAVTSDPAQVLAANYITSLGAWSNFNNTSAIDNQGGTGATWRIYDGYTAPLLRAFLTALTVTANSATGTYNGAAQSVSGYTTSFSPFLPDPSLLLGTAVDVGGTGTDAASYTHSISGLYSGQNGYDITLVSGALTIDPAQLTASLTGTTTKTYDGGLTATLAPANFVVSGFFNSDGVNVSQTAGTYASANVGSGIGVTASLTPANFTATGTTNLANYILPTTASGAIGAITPASLLVTYVAGAANSIYGTTPGTSPNAALTGTLSATGLASVDSLANVLSGTASWTTTATSANGVGSYAITGSGLSGNSGNYIFSFAQDAGNATALTITPRSLLVSANNGQSSVYGSAISTPLTYTVGGLTASTGLVNGDGFSGALATSATSSSNVGSYGITQGSLTAGSNYAISYTGANYAITPAALLVTYTANAASSIYGTTPSGLSGGISASGLVNSDTLAGVTSGTASWGTTATSTSSIGSYAITGSGVSGNSGNYNFTFAQAAGNATALTITPRSLFVTATSGLSSVYGSAIAPLTYSVGATTGTTGLVNGDGLSGALATAATSHSNVGTYGITQGGLTAGANYNITYTGANYAITPAALTVTYIADPTSSVYGTTPGITPNIGFAGGYAVSGLVNNDTLFGVLGGTLHFGTTATSTSNVGSYAINGSGLALTSGNYTLSSVQAAINATALTINPRLVVINPNASQSSVYGMPLAPTYSVGAATTTTGLVNGGTLSGVLGLGGAASIPNVGTYNITLGTLTGGSNYYLGLGNAAVSYHITPAQISVAATSGTSVYGTSPANPGLTVTGMGTGSLVTNQMAALQLTGLSNSFGITGTTNVTGSPYALTVLGTLTNANYTITARLGGSWTVTPASVIVSYNATPVSRPYFSTNPTVTGTVSASGLVNGATLANVTTGTASWSTNATQGSNAGHYYINGAGLSVKANANYTTTIVQAGGNATAFTINPLTATITYTANTASKVYGAANPAFSGSYTVSGLVNGATIGTISSGTATFTSPATVATGVGKWAINGSGLVSTSVNYIFNNVQAAGNATALTITPAPLTLTPNAISRLYGAATPASDSVTASGLLNGDTVASETVTTTATTSSAVGSYGLTGSNAVFSHGSAANYTITYAANQYGLTITPAPLTLTYTANAVSRLYGASNPTFTGTVVATGLVAGDTLATATSGGVNWTSTASALSNAGSYAINGAGLIAAHGNYTITNAQAAGNATALTVNPATVTITYAAYSAQRTYGTINGTYGGVVSTTGLMNGDTLAKITTGTAVYTSTADVTTSVGKYAINGSGLVANSANYIFNFVQASWNATDLTITPRLLTLQANAMSITQGSAIPTTDSVTDIWPSTGSSSNNGLVNGDTISGETVTSNATTGSGPGGYALIGSNAVFSHGSASNYTISYYTNQWGLTIH